MFLYAFEVLFVSMCRTKLDLWSNVVWCKTLQGVKTRLADVDVVLIRENTEGEYSSLEHEVRLLHTL
jgi:isocitrate dehydrogenase (NAD+)